MGMLFSIVYVIGVAFQSESGVICNLICKGIHGLCLAHSVLGKSYRCRDGGSAEHSGCTTYYMTLYLKPPTTNFLNVFLKVKKIPCSKACFKAQ